jgi:single-strand DNA-binding protein
VIFSEGLAKIAEQYLKKGAKVYLEGQLQTRKWQDQQGQDRYTTEVVLQGFSSALTMLDRAGGGAGGGDYGSDDAEFGASSPTAPRRPAVAAVGAGVSGGGGGKGGDLNDEIPF